MNMKHWSFAALYMGLSQNPGDSASRDEDAEHDALCCRVAERQYTLRRPPHYLTRAMYTYTHTARGRFDIVWVDDRPHIVHAAAYRCHDLQNSNEWAVAKILATADAQRVWPPPDCPWQWHSIRLAGLSVRCWLAMLRRPTPWLHCPAWWGRSDEESRTCPAAAVAGHGEHTSLPTWLRST